MLLELSEMLSKVENPERVVIDNYNMKNGLYVRLNKEGEIKDELIVNKDTDFTSDIYIWFKERDYYSNVINPQKAVFAPGGRYIESNNIYTFFAKYRNLPKIKNAVDLKKINETVDGYYNKLNKEYDNTNKEITLLEIAKAYRINIEELECCKDIISKSIRLIVNDEKNLDKIDVKEDYIKLFVESDVNEDNDIKNYIRESSRYLALKLFIKNNYNKEYNNTIYGCSYENIVLSDNKPYLELKSTKFKAPFMVSFEQAIKNYKIMQWVKNAKDDEGNQITDFSLKWDYDFKTKPNNKGCMGQHFKIERNKNVKYEDYVVVENDIISHDISNLKEYFKFYNYLDDKNCKIKNCGKRYELESCINNVFFKNSDSDCNINSFCKNAKEIMRIPMKNYFKLGIENSLNSLIDKITLGIIISNINNEDMKKHDIICQENLRLNLLRYFKIGGKENMGEILSNVMENVTKKVNLQGYTPIESDEEYYFCVGQLTYYLCSLSEADKIKQSVYNSILKVKNNENLEKALKDLYIKYNYKIDINSTRFNKFNSMIKGYKPETKVNTDMIICGLSVNNIIYSKKEDNRGN